ncbi:hypothetical protein T492DRAFT_1120308, partial [Pavlovales sp. CCMP2436]
QCLFSFICSSNNNIGRITGILARLRAAYGTQIPILNAEPFGELAELPAFYAFPTIERLAQVPDEELRALGLGYRARFIRETATLLLEVLSFFLLIFLHILNSKLYFSSILFIMYILPKICGCRLIREPAALLLEVLNLFVFFK